MQNNERMAERLFTSSEIAYCEAKSSKWQSYAARFAAKEAVMKALGTGWDGEVNWKDIEIVNDANGNPGVLLSGGAKKKADELGLSHAHISLTHEKDYAIAFAILEA
jgi:holo-[acyl-carrier protein] synthase